MFILRVFHKNQIAQQVFMPALSNCFFAALCQNFDTPFQFFGCDDWLPVSVYGFGWNTCFWTHDPASIEPVAEPFGQSIDCSNALSILDCDKRASAAIFITPFMKLFADLLQCVAVGEE